MITIFIAIVLIPLLYFGVRTVPTAETVEGAAETNTIHDHDLISADSIIAEARATIPEHARGEIEKWEEKLSTLSDSSQIASVYDSLGRIWQEHKQLPVAAYYYLQSGKLENSEKTLNFASRLFLDLARRSPSEQIQNWSGKMAKEGFAQALEINPENDTSRLYLAECYIGTGETMQGITMLLELTDRNPNNVPANLILGQQGIVSGQLNKAIERFQTVLKIEPDNIEGLLGLAEAYKNKGNTEQAIELLNRAKKVMNNPAFDKDVDEYIKTFK